MTRDEGKPEWFPCWDGETVVVVASGPSAKDVLLQAAKGAARFIAVNTSWRLVPWADALYAADFAWWNQYKGCPDFSGLKLSTDKKSTEREDWNIRFVKIDRGTDGLVLDRPNVVGWGGNSGFHSINIAAHSGCRKIILVGFDMTLDHGIHWHGKHPERMNNPRKGNIGRWRRAVDGAAKTLAGIGVTAINCSPVSALENYPKMTFEQALHV
jgi:hypothetical protein